VPITAVCAGGGLAVCGSSFTGLMLTVTLPVVLSAPPELCASVAVSEGPADHHRGGQGVRAVGIGDLLQGLIDPRLRGIGAQEPELQDVDAVLVMNWPMVVLSTAK
jgi:hypothetical protein